jgi:ribosomal protein L11 methyltransferase
VSLVRLAIAVRDEAELERLLAALPDGVADGREFVLYRPAAELPGAPELDALARGEVTVAPVRDGWRTAHRAHLRREVVGELAVRPPWLPGEPDDLVLEPGATFGLAGHVTTRLCLELLQELEPGGPLADWGTGCGVLAVAAARLGWAPVTAIDLDGAALVAANAAANGVRVEALEGDVTRSAPWADTVVANLTLPLLRAAAAATARPPRLLLASGILAGEVDALLEAWPLLRPAQRRERDGWAAVVLVVSAT